MSWHARRTTLEHLTHWLAVLGVALLGTILTIPVWAQDVSASARGSLVRVSLPIPGENVRPTIDRIQRTIDNLLDPAARLDGDRPILILELIPAPPSKFGEGCSFFAALDLADYLTSPKLVGAKTIAYVPQSLKGHGVLVAMACEQIVMSPDAEIGEAGIDEQETTTLRPIVRTGYEQIALARRTIPEAIALGMVDRSLQVWKVDVQSGTKYVLAEERDALGEHETVTNEEELIATGTLGNFDGGEARQLGLAKRLVTNRDDLAAALHLPAAAVVESQTITGEVRPVMFEVDGPITGRTASQIKTMLGDEKAKGSRWIGVRINGRGGEMEHCLALADLFAMQDLSEVRVVAFVPVEAAGGAALVALACDQIVMRPDARLGGDGGRPLDPRQLAAVTDTIRQSLAPRAKRDWSIFVAMIDPHLEIYKYRHNETGRIRLLSTTERDALPDVAAWIKQGEPLTTDGKSWELTAERAKQLGIAWHTTDNVETLAELYGLGETPRLVEPNWALELIQALASPGFATMLLAIGFIGVYVELHAPGIGIGGFVACVAFLLFFWSNFLEGGANWLEVLLFVGGICFILLEVFVIPGFGIFGLGGGLMVIASLILASMTSGFLPHSTKDMIELRRSLSVVTGAGVGVIIASMLLRRYLPHTPMFSRLLLNPPSQDEQKGIGYHEGVADYSHMVGQVGTAATNLRPSGKGNFAGELVDVIADSDPIDHGQPIRIVHTQGARILVRPADKA